MPNPTQSLEGDANEVRDIIAGAGMLTQLLGALGQDQSNNTPKGD